MTWHDPAEGEACWVSCTREFGEVARPAPPRFARDHGERIHANSFGFASPILGTHPAGDAPPGKDRGQALWQPKLDAKVRGPYRPPRPAPCSRVLEEPPFPASRRRSPGFDQ